MPLPTINAVGVASPSAQGQAMTSTETVLISASVKRPNPGSTQGKKRLTHTVMGRSAPGKRNQAKKVSSATPTMIGTKTAVTRSAKAWMGTLVP